MKKVEAVVGGCFPEALNALKAALAVVAVGCIADNQQPTTLILLGRSGAGKSLALNFLIPESGDTKLEKVIYRCDKVTTAAFVSHKADLTSEELEGVDLLPRIRGKTMVSKELAPFFAGKREELLERFATLASVLDGKGFISDSGAHGRRGYAEPINFQWLGATTPLSPEALDVMAHVGPRILFYDADRPRKDAEALVEYAKRQDNQQAIDACHGRVRDLVLLLHRSYPPDAVKTTSVAFSDTCLWQLARWADVLTRLRARTPRNSASEVEPIEHPERVFGMLRNVAIGSALVHSRASVDDYDLAQVGHIALSSGVETRGRVLRALLASDGTATTPQVEKLAGISTPTALDHMRGLAAVRLARFIESKSTTPARLELRSKFSPLCEAPLHKANRGEGENRRGRRKANGGEGGSGRA
jgi:hypothetical protein